MVQKPFPLHYADADLFAGGEEDEYFCPLVVLEE